MIPALDHALMKQKGIDVSAVMIPAKEVGGDFYDFFFIDENRVGICIADVSGKGVPAALFMAMTKTLVKASAMSGLFPADCMDYVNRFLSQDNDTCMFVSVFFAILDLAKHELCYANGGHNLPYIVRKGSPPVFLQQLKGMVLGIDDGTYEEKIIPFPPGDILYTYTDGVTEAMNPQEELMGEARLEEILKAHTAQGPEHLTAQVLEEIKTFASGAPQSDDITMMALSLPFSYPGVTDSQA
jgi:sigma-B regulation protein RsbU (phosphoserine phosphatase)